VLPADTNLDNPILGGALIAISTPSPDCTVGTQPAFAWHATGRKLLYVGVFQSNISVAEGQIVNPLANVWAWHSGLGSGRDGNVFFRDGVDVKNGALVTGVAPTPLTHGASYVWAVWAWDDAGQKVIQSSKEVFFKVDSTKASTCP
jgi:hypothetical protein